MEIASIVISSLLSLIAISVSIYTFKTNKKYNLMNRQPLFKIYNISEPQITSSNSLHIFIIEANKEPYILKEIRLDNNDLGYYYGKSEHTRRNGKEVVSRIEGFSVSFPISRERGINNRLIIEYEDFEGKLRTVKSDVIEIDNGKLYSKINGSSFIFI
jgi:hypothetical protein